MDLLLLNIGDWTFFQKRRQLWCFRKFWTYLSWRDGFETNCYWIVEKKISEHYIVLLNSNSFHSQKEQMNWKNTWISFLLETVGTDNITNDKTLKNVVTKHTNRWVFKSSQRYLLSDIRTEEASSYFRKLQQTKKVLIIFGKDEKPLNCGLFEESIVPEIRKTFYDRFSLPKRRGHKKLKPWIELHIRTNKTFWNRIMFNVGVGKNNRVEFRDETLIFTITKGKYIYKLIDNFEFKGLNQNFTKKWFLNFWSNLTLHLNSKGGPTFLWNIDLS